MWYSLSSQTNYYMHSYIQSLDKRNIPKYYTYTHIQLLIPKVNIYIYVLIHSNMPTPLYTYTLTNTHIPSYTHSYSHSTHFCISHNLTQCTHLLSHLPSFLCSLKGSYIDTHSYELTLIQSDRLMLTQAHTSTVIQKQMFTIHLCGHKL